MSVMFSGTRACSRTRALSLPSMIMSRENSLATTISVRSSRPRSSRSSTSWAMGASIIAFMAAARVVAAVLADGAGVEQAAVEFVAILKAIGRHAGGRAHGRRSVLREGDIERAVLAPEEPRGGERLQLLAFAEIQALADIDERRH